MRISFEALNHVPLFSKGIPSKLRLASSANKKKRKKKNEKHTDVILLPLISRPYQFYKLEGEEPGPQSRLISAFYKADELPDDFQPGIVDVQLEGEKSSLHMSRHLMESLEFVRAKFEFESFSRDQTLKALLQDSQDDEESKPQSQPVEYMTMPRVRRRTLELLLFDDDCELDDVDSTEYFEALQMYKMITPTIMVSEKDKLQLFQQCDPRNLDGGRVRDRERINTIIATLLRKENNALFHPALTYKSDCRCIRGHYSLATTRPKHAVTITIRTKDAYGQFNSSNGIFSHEYLNEPRAGSQLDVVVDGKLTISHLLTPIVACQSDADHRDFVKTMARNEISKLIPEDLRDLAREIVSTP